MTIHQSEYGTYHPREGSGWTIHDTRGYMNKGSSCTACGACECCNAYEADCGCMGDGKACIPESHEDGCDFNDEWAWVDNCVGLPFAYINLDDGEALCQECADNAGITITECDC